VRQSVRRNVAKRGAGLGVSERRRCRCSKGTLRYEDFLGVLCALPHAARLGLARPYLLRLRACARIYFSAVVQP